MLAIFAMIPSCPHFNARRVDVSENEKQSRTDSGGGQKTVKKHDQGFRETVESLAVAVILALLFRGFVAEAFVIPTGSMAPTLMGAHKDVSCEQCGYQYQAGASLENRDLAPGRGNYTGDDVWRNGRSVFAAICPNCRSENGLELGRNRLHDTFDGDRILVSKFSYALSEPERWDVIVFKYPHNAKQNYIKRLVGLENETLRIRSGDVYAKPDGDDEFSILRKSPAKQLAMSHLVFDTAHQARALVEAGWPSRWQPWQWGATSPPTDGWQVEQQTGAFSARLELSAADESNAEQPVQWLRYFHHLPTDEEWDRAKQGLTLAGVEPYRGSAITDFYGYDAYVSVFNNYLFSAPGRLKTDYDPASASRQFPPAEEVHFGQMRPVVEVGNSGVARRGMHWVGDLMVELTAEVQSDSGVLYLDLVEAGVHHRCEIDVATGAASLMLVNGEDVAAFDGGEKNLQPTATTSVRGPGTYHLRFANYDNQLRLWVDGDHVEFDQPTTFEPSSFVTEYRPYFSPEDPLDAAPVAIGGDRVAVTIHHAKILRDKYYIATRLERAGEMMADYDYQQLASMGFFNESPERAHGVPHWQARLIQTLLSEPDLWSDYAEFWTTSRQLEFRLEDNQYFPMGDNSPESQDARSWPGDPYIDRDMLIGKALLIFWPHAWPEPIPFTPNFSRMRFIR